MVVIDDSIDEAISQQNHKIANDLSAASGRYIRYCGLLEKTVLCDHVVRIIPDHNQEKDARLLSDFIRFSCVHSDGGLSISSPGRNRNASFLMNAGKRVLSVDDDALFQFSRASVPSHSDAIEHNGTTLADKLIVASFTHPNEFSGFFETSQHDIILEMDKALDTDDVSVAMTGIMGNRWYGRPSYFLHLKGTMRKISYYPKKRYSQRRCGPFAFFQPVETTFAKNPSLITCCHGLDMTKMLPPFPPLGHADDSVFGALLRYCQPESVTAYLPVCIHHVLDAVRLVSKKEFHDVTLPFAASTRILINYLARNAVPSTLDPEDRLIHMGTMLMEAGALKYSDWIDVMQELFILYATSEIEVLNSLLQQYDDEPVWWARDVHEHMERLIERSADPQSSIPKELRASGIPPEEATRIFQGFCYRYGELMTYWPAIWRAAQKNADEIITRT